MKRAMTPEDRAITARMSPEARKTYERAHTADAIATALWVKRQGYLDIERRVRCLAVVDSYWEVVKRNPRKKK